MTAPADTVDPDHLTIRQAIVERIELELLGPSAPDELLTMRPQDAYLLGALAPSGSPISEEDTEAERAGADEEHDDSESTAYGGLKQSAIGLTVVFPTTALAPVELVVEFGTYHEQSTPLGPRRWRRRPHTLVHVWSPKRSGTGQVPLPMNGSLEWRARVRNNDIFLTVSLVNRNDASLKSQQFLFQPRIVVRTTDPAGTPFIEGSQRRRDDHDPDRESDRLLYREVMEYAAGHGCAATWTRDDQGRVAEIRTEQLPRYELPVVAPLAETAAELGMETLAQAEHGPALATMLAPIVIEYVAWIDAQERRIAGLQDDLQDVARRHIAECREAAARIRDGIDLLASDERVAEAFRQANAAMALQRGQSEIAAKFRASGRRTPSGSEPTWRPFQLAFFLLNMRSLARPTSADARLVDLLWFPTGGGKTEAYLGLTAFVLFLRRLGVVVPGTSGAAGTAVLMRYTLRLLTAQQFERAAVLICACEVLRREDPERWGAEPFTIGLWIGSTSTPNRFEDAVKALEEIATNRRKLSEHPFVLRTCPWCGEPLGFASFEADRKSQRIRIACGRSDCEFSTGTGGLPVLVVDDEIYRRPPSMILGTVDKFARLPWVPESGALFGHAAFQCDRHGLRPTAGCLDATCRVRRVELLSAPPALIIQDELHLISGPLGSLMGLYETAVDYLSTRSVAGVVYRPKIVASTATIRRASEQVRGLFARDVRLFPPPALDPFESHFARRLPTETKPGRLFLGLCAFGRSSKTMQVRLYATILNAVYPFREQPEIADAYWTLVGYYNSLAQLGGAVSLVQDDIQTRLRAQQNVTGAGRVIERHDELTSRVPSTEIPEKLRKLQQTLAGGDAYDVMLASNMISVGLDVGRLSVMVINAQPKATSEYIQASSRIGREHPGLAVIAYNWTAPRDLSHYEHFLTYHRTLYRHVEATSVTPFSPRARDRALHAILIAALRLTHPALAPQDAADSFSRDKYDVGPLVEFFRERVTLAAETAPADGNEPEHAVEELMRLIEAWEEAAANPTKSLIFSQRTKPGRRTNKAPLMIPAGPELNATDRVTNSTLDSLRDVEQGAEWRRI